MPDSQENDWEHLGFTSEIEFVHSIESWEEATANLEIAIQSFRRIQPIVVEAEDSMRRFILQCNQADALEEEQIRETEAMAIDIRHGEYPGRDSYGTYWYDPSGFHSDDSHVCFICERPTHRVDIDYHAAFCNSEECNDVIRQDLERLNGGPEQRD